MQRQGSHVFISQLHQLHTDIFELVETMFGSKLRGEGRASVASKRAVKSPCLVRCCAWRIHLRLSPRVVTARENHVILDYLWEWVKMHCCRNGMTEKWETRGIRAIVRW